MLPLFATWAASVCLHFRLSVCWVAYLVLGLLFGVCPLSKHFSAVLVCAWDIRHLFTLLLDPLKFRNVLKQNIPRAEVPLLVIKILKKTSAQRWRFSFALNRKETKRHTCKQILHKHPRNARVISAELTLIISFKDALDVPSTRPLLCSFSFTVT